MASTWGQKTQPNRSRGVIIRPLPEGTSSGREGRVGTWEEGREEDGHPGGGQQTESTVELTEGGAMVEEGLTTPGGQPRRRRSPGRRRRVDEPGRWGGSGGPKQMAQVTLAEAGIRKAAVEPERQRTWSWRKEEPDGAGGTRCSRRSGVLRWLMVDDRPRWSRRDEWTVDWGATAERRELGAMVEPLGRWAEVESRTQRRRQGDPPAMMPMETGRPAVIPPHIWWAEGEHRGCQTTVGEEAGAGGRVVGWVFVSLQALRAALRNKSPPWAALGNSSIIWVRRGNRSPSLG